MKKKYIFIGAGVAAVAVIALIVGLIIHGRNSGLQARDITVYEATGKVHLIRSTKNMVVSKDMKLKNKDEVNVDLAAFLRLCLDDDKFVYADEDTNFIIEATGTSANSKSNINLLKGGIVCEVRNKLENDSTFTIQTPNTTMAIRGTVTYAFTEPTGETDENGQPVYKSTMSCLEGECVVAVVGEDGKVTACTLPAKAAFSIACAATDSEVMIRISDPENMLEGTEIVSVDEFVETLSASGITATGDVDFSEIGDLMDKVVTSAGDDASGKLLTADGNVNDLTDGGEEPTSKPTTEPTSEPSEEPTDTPTPTEDPTPETTQVPDNPDPADNPPVDDQGDNPPTDDAGVNPPVDDNPPAPPAPEPPVDNTPADNPPVVTPTATPTAAPTTEPTETPTPTEEPEETPTPTEVPEETPTPTEEPTETPTPTEEPTQTPSPTEEPTQTPSPTEEPTPTEPEPTYADDPTPTEPEPTPVDEPTPTESEPTPTEPEPTPVDEPTPTESEPTPTEPEPTPTEEVTPTPVEYSVSISCLNSSYSEIVSSFYNDISFVSNLSNSGNTVSFTFASNEPLSLPDTDSFDAIGALVWKIAGTGSDSNENTEIEVISSELFDDSNELSIALVQVYNYQVYLNYADFSNSEVGINESDIPSSSNVRLNYNVAAPLGGMTYTYNDEETAIESSVTLTSWSIYNYVYVSGWEYVVNDEAVSVTSFDDSLYQYAQNGVVTLTPVWKKALTLYVSDYKTGSEFNSGDFTLKGTQDGYKVYIAIMDDEDESLTLPMAQYCTYDSFDLGDYTYSGIMKQSGWVIESDTYDVLDREAYDTLMESYLPITLYDPSGTEWAGGSVIFAQSRSDGAGDAGTTSEYTFVLTGGGALNANTHILYTRYNYGTTELYDVTDTSLSSLLADRGIITGGQMLKVMRLCDDDGLYFDDEYDAVISADQLFESGKLYFLEKFAEPEVISVGLGDFLNSSYENTMICAISEAFGLKGIVLQTDYVFDLSTYKGYELPVFKKVSEIENEALMGFSQLHYSVTGQNGKVTEYYISGWKIDGTTEEFTTIPSVWTHEEDAIVPVWTELKKIVVGIDSSHEVSPGVFEYYNSGGGYRFYSCYVRTGEENVAFELPVIQNSAETVKIQASGDTYYAYELTGWKPDSSTLSDPKKITYDEYSSLAGSRTELILNQNWKDITSDGVFVEFTDGYSADSNSFFYACEESLSLTELAGDLYYYYTGVPDNSDRPEKKEHARNCSIYSYLKTELDMDYIALPDLRNVTTETNISDQNPVLVKGNRYSFTARDANKISYLFRLTVSGETKSLGDITSSYASGVTNATLFIENISNNPFYTNPLSMDIWVKYADVHDTDPVVVKISTLNYTYSNGNGVFSLSVNGNEDIYLEGEAGSDSLYSVNISRNAEINQTAKIMGIYVTFPGVSVPVTE